MTEIVTAQIERYAPGFRDVIVGSRCIPAATRVLREQFGVRQLPDIGPVGR